ADLSIRIEGKFRLRFSLVNLRGRDTDQLTQTETRVLTTVDSDVFTVYSGKSFPGLVPFSDLSSTLALQGVRLPNRRRRGSAAGRRDDDSDEDR
ncbi:hypothetical protein HDU76_009579, partial [Blyttiomyces sp. JEL0837]